MSLAADGGDASYCSTDVSDEAYHEIYKMWELLKMGAITREEFETVRQRIVEQNKLPQALVAPTTAVPLPAPPLSFVSSSRPSPALADIPTSTPELPNVYLERSRSLALLKRSLLDGDSGSSRTALTSSTRNHAHRKVAAHGMVRV